MLLAVVVTVAALYFAREVFIPCALALLLSFLLAPIVNRFRRWLGRVPAVIITVAWAAVVILGVGWFVTLQLYDVVGKLPDYQQTILRKVKSLNGPGGNVLSRAQKMIKETEQNLAPPEEPDVPGPPTNPATPSKKPDEKPVPVEIKPPRPSPVSMIQTLLGSIMNPLATAGIVAVFVIFMLIHLEDLRDRFLRLMGTGQMHLTTDALNDAADRVSRFLLMNLIVNVTYAIPIGIGLVWIGVPNALFWAFLAFVLRFIPYLGPVLAALMPIGLAFAVDDGWSMFLATVALFVVIELISNNLIEPWLYGTTTGISPVAVIAGAVFWTWLWGPVGLLLSTPLTVCLVVVGRYFPQMQAFNILFGEEPVLTPPARFYQRLLARDSEGTLELAVGFLKAKPLLELYETVIAPALALAEHDIQHDTLPPEKQQFIWQTIRELIEEFDDHRDATLKEEDTHAGQAQTLELLTPSPIKASIYFIPARDEADEMLCRMLAQLAKRRGIGARALASSTLVAEYLEEINQGHITMVCFASLPPIAVRQVRYLAKRLRNALPQLQILVHLWQADEDRTSLRERLALAQSDLLGVSLPETIEQVNAIVRTTTPSSTSPTDLPVAEDLVTR